MVGSLGTKGAQKFIYQVIFLRRNRKTNIYYLSKKKQPKNLVFFHPNIYNQRATMLYLCLYLSINYKVLTSTENGSYLLGRRCASMMTSY